MGWCFLQETFHGSKPCIVACTVVLVVRESIIVGSVVHPSLDLSLLVSH